MTSLQHAIVTALSPLIGLPVWQTRRALDLQMFDFGRKRRLHAKNTRVVGEYGLHIECPWRIVGPDGIVVGSIDRAFPADEHADWETFDDEKDLSQLEARIAEWLNTHQAAPLKVIRVKADSAGGFQIFLEQKFVLEAFPAHSLRGEYSEYWRIFRPSAMLTHRFTVTGQGFCGRGIWK